MNATNVNACTFTLLSDDDLLAKLAEERSKFTKANESFMHRMIDILVARGVYPANEGKKNTPYVMVSGWGAYWHQWTGILECPHCKADFRDYTAGPPFSRLIGISNRDSVYAYRCPDCNAEWDRKGYEKR